MADEDSPPDGCTNGIGNLIARRTLPLSIFEVMKHDVDATFIYCTNHKKDQSIFLSTASFTQANKLRTKA